MSEKRLSAEHGTVCYMPQERYGYFAWPTIAALDDGTLVVGASGLRYDHICPWGKAVLFRSSDDGRTWSVPRILADTPLSDYCLAVVSLGEGRLLASWYSLDIRPHAEWARENYDLDEAEQARWRAVLDTYTDELVARWQNSWIRVSVDGEAWGDYVKAPVNSPSGPLLCRDGSLLYLGKKWGSTTDAAGRPICAVRSIDEGKTWTELGSVPLCEGLKHDDLHEPDVVELPSGKLLGLIRYVDTVSCGRFVHQSMFQTVSEDGGKTWSEALPLGFHGMPPNIIRHSSGALVCAYCQRIGRRQSVMISRDEGETWDHDWILRDDVPPRDHGYPASIEMADGSILTVYYQRGSDEHKNCGIFWSRWRLPEA